MFVSSVDRNFFVTFSFLPSSHRCYKMKLYLSREVQHSLLSSQLGAACGHGASHGEHLICLFVSSNMTNSPRWSSSTKRFTM